MCYAHLAFVRFVQSVCRGSLTTTYIYIYLYVERRLLKNVTQGKGIY